MKNAVKIRSVIHKAKFSLIWLIYILFRGVCTLLFVAVSPHRLIALDDRKSPDRLGSSKFQAEIIIILK